MKSFWAIVLVVASFFYSFPLRAEAPKEPTMRYFTFNVKPVNPKRTPDWNKECLFRISHDEIGEMSFAGGGTEPGKGSKGIFRSGTPFVALKETRELEWIYMCGNDLTLGWDRKVNAWVLPKDWRPEGVWDCPSESAKEVAPQSSSVGAPPETYHGPLGLQPENLNPGPLTIGRIGQSEFATLPDSKSAKPPVVAKKSHAGLYVLLGVVVVGGLTYAILSSRSSSDEKPKNGGPSPDPKNRKFIFSVAVRL